MGVTKVNITTLPKNPLESNLPGIRLNDGRSNPNVSTLLGLELQLPVEFLTSSNVAPQDLSYYLLPIPQEASGSNYQSWVAARKAQGFIFWKNIKIFIYYR